MNAPIRIKTFQSRTVQEAYELIRKEFGPEASILETRVAKRGWLKGRRVEIVASSAETPEPSPSPQLDLVSNQNRGESQADRPKQDITLDAASCMEQPPVDPKHEFSQAKLRRICTQVFNELCEAGLDRTIAEQWIEAAKASCDHSVLESAWSLSAELTSWVQGFVHVGNPIALEQNSQQVIALVGPAGAGKSTAIAKIASSISADSGLRIGVIDTDPRQGDCQGLLRPLSELLGWKLRTIHDGDAISSLDHFRDCDLVLVDTCGFSPREQNSIEDLNELLSSLRVTSTYLALPATYNSNSFVRLYETFSRLQPDGLILTKLDEAGGLGPLFACLQSCPTPVSYLASGRQVPSELSLATRQRLAHLILHAD